jgi:hypothetical protein
MVRVKGQPADKELLVMVEWGMFFDEVKASDGLVVVTFDGYVVSAALACEIFLHLCL